MRDFRTSDTQNNGFNTEYRAYNLKASSWSEFTASKYLRNLVYAFVAAGSLIPAMLAISLILRLASTLVVLGNW